MFRPRSKTVSFPKSKPVFTSRKRDGSDPCIVPDMAAIKKARASSNENESDDSGPEELLSRATSSSSIGNPKTVILRGKHQPNPQFDVTLPSGE